jgi:predicted NUDIX family NTP pyrophosphohydrolase
MKRKSAGILLYRLRDREFEVLLGHPGGPFWASKDNGAWSIPKGEFDAEEPLAAARREFEEETGFPVEGPFLTLTPRKQKSGKTIYAFAAEGDLDVGRVRSNLFEMEWPPRSGRTAAFPEIDRAGWFALPEAHLRIQPGQSAFLHELLTLLQSRTATG